MLDLENLIREFFYHLEKNKSEIEIYNEFSFQHELGIFLREKLNHKGYQIRFEINVRCFGYEPKETYEKKEIDIIVRSKHNKNELYAIELKFANKTNGQHPEKMFSFIKDILFMETVKAQCKEFIENYCVTFVEDDKFYTGRKIDGVYAYFRSGKEISGKIEKPTGDNKFTISLRNSYKIKWEELSDKKKFYIVKV
ncbi:hypothetical protein SAMN02745664_102128 [Moraxella cuniculi DSM 21768]|uniref:PD-(D/E)XK nuclease superfamily protein n=1 Tax=Moraxella cuniculi DSM 21768 TaxID=1122245 RepID=A0A1N7DUW5_9GAMM|nr:hypothetical protein [Moraxella cuniculi]OOS07422.1 hypothetical protein B0189_03090 [Moraxella cuniculi]SIR79495.1 hypothetical protein SAMN02745664_102128 [Moraxella cuniculi DSM 21768]